MFNENVAYFDRYAAIYLARVFVFLELLAETIHQRYGLKTIGAGSACSSPGFEIIVDWMNYLKREIENGY